MISDFERIRDLVQVIEQINCHSGQVESHSPGAYVVNESPVRLSGCKGATYINVLRGHQGT